MRSSFRFVDAARDTAVNLFLFKSPSGMAQAVVMGPALDRISEDVVCPFVPLPLDKAFAVAIRAANRNDVEILVSGDRSLWDDRWGWLTPWASPIQIGVQIANGGDEFGGHVRN